MELVYLIVVFFTWSAIVEDEPEPEPVNEAFFSLTEPMQNPEPVIMVIDVVDPVDEEQTEQIHQKVEFKKGYYYKNKHGYYISNLEKPPCLDNQEPLVGQNKGCLE